MGFIILVFRVGSYATFLSKKTCWRPGTGKERKRVWGVIFVVARKNHAGWAPRQVLAACGFHEAVLRVMFANGFNVLEL